MSEQPHHPRPSPPRDRGMNLGVFDRPGQAGPLGAADLIALALSLAWLVGAGVFFLVLGVGDGGAGAYAMVLLALVLPVAMIWLAAMTAKSVRAVRDEAERMHQAIDAVRQMAVDRAQSSGTVLPPSVEKKLDELARAQRKTETAIATFSSIRHEAAQAATPASVPPPASAPTSQEAQASFALDGETLPQTDLSIEAFIRALNFPETTEDKAGFRALRQAMADPRARKLVQASQDVLTLISQDGIYMDDLAPDRARPELWRRFANGERGRGVAALGGIRDRTSLALVSSRMRRDPIFRDTAHHFLRAFDTVFAEFEKAANDAEIIAMAETRTARAFMLLGRATGIFD